MHIYCTTCIHLFKKKGKSASAQGGSITSPVEGRTLFWDQLIQRYYDRKSHSVWSWLTCFLLALGWMIFTFIIVSGSRKDDPMRRMDLCTQQSVEFFHSRTKYCRTKMCWRSLQHWQTSKNKWNWVRNIVTVAAKARNK